MVERLGEATRASDAIVTCTTADQPFLDIRDVRPGTSDHLLADIGLSLEQARREARKPFWAFSRDGTSHCHRPQMKATGIGSPPKGRKKRTARVLATVPSAPLDIAAFLMCIACKGFFAITS
jgi:hypothetical protein